MLSKVCQNDNLGCTLLNIWLYISEANVQP
jgi:hypothetical protein